MKQESLFQVEMRDQTPVIVTTIRGKKVSIWLEGNGVAVGVEGYGTWDTKEGPVVLVDLYGSIPAVFIWNEINEQDPLPFISLKYASEKYREGDDES